MTRYLTAAILVLSWAFPGGVSAQAVDEEEREKIETPATPDTSGKRPDLDKAARDIIDRTNDFRKQEGRDPVKTNPKLMETARSFADYMAQTDEYGHTADGNRPSERAKKHNYDYCILLENIAYAFDSRGYETKQLADQFVTGWKNSPGHRQNMLDPDVTETGVAVARSEKTGYYYAVQMFGRPKSAAIRFAIENRSGDAISYKIGDRPFDLPTRMTRTHTSCRPATATFQWPGSKKPDATAKPASGDRFIISKEGDHFALKKQ